MDASLQQDLDVAVSAAQQGGDAIKPWMGRLQGADFKGEVDPVTVADRESEEMIIAAIKAARPEDDILAEESGGDPLGRERVWIIDPLDGTVNFLHGVPHVGVSIALYEQGLPRVGVVVDVFRGEVFTAAAGAGARCNGKPISVSRQDGLGAALVATGLPYDRRRFADLYAQILGEMLKHVQGIRRMGTASLDLAWVACGRYDGYWELKLAPWDVAAGILLVREAGGQVTDLDGKPARPGDPAVVASNPLLANTFCERVAAAIPDAVFEPEIHR
ncbi:MAG: inositol monophosphatase family protein [Acidimicrobiia bacterium]|nr:inositol monophosphatase family protein [Acidimicrobiia bacterium]